MKRDKAEWVLIGLYVICLVVQASFLIRMIAPP